MRIGFSRVTGSVGLCSELGDGCDGCDGCDGDGAEGLGGSSASIRDAPHLDLLFEGLQAIAYL